MLDYAANAVAYWPTERLQLEFEAAIEASGREPDTVLREFLNGDRPGSAERIVVHGRSLGGAVAGLLVASRPEPAGLILESTFTDLAGIAAAVYPLLPRFLLRRLQGHYDTRAAISTVRLPVLVIHGAKDELIPASMGRELARAAGRRARLLEIAGAGHNDLPFVAGSDYFEGVAAFVREVTAGGPSAETP